MSSTLLSVLLLVTLPQLTLNDVPLMLVPATVANPPPKSVVIPALGTTETKSINSKPVSKLSLIEQFGEVPSGIVTIT